MALTRPVTELQTVHTVWTDTRIHAAPEGATVSLLFERFLPLLVSWCNKEDDRCKDWSKQDVHTWLTGEKHRESITWHLTVSSLQDARRSELQRLNHPESHHVATLCLFTRHLSEAAHKMMHYLIMSGTKKLWSFAPCQPVTHSLPH